MPVTPKDIRFGRLAIQNKIATDAQVRECLGLLEKSANGLPLGQVLLKKGYINARQYQAVSKHLDGAAAPDPAPAKPAQEAKSAPAAKTAEPKTPQAETGMASPRVEGAGMTASSSQKVYTANEVARMNLESLVGKPLVDYLELARRIGASDLHFQVGAPPYVRLHGRMVYLRHPNLASDYTLPRVQELFSEWARGEFEKHFHVDFCFEAPHGRYRCNAYVQKDGVDAIFRVIPDHIPSVEELQLPPIVKEFTKYRQGIVLITGPAGSGKSATMASLVELINRERNDHILTFEDPIEYIYESKGCNVNQRHVGVETASYASGLRSAMRADPDYMCVGEMRDLETISMAITAAETGHLVFGTLHTTNAPRSVDRLIDVYPAREQEQIRAMVSESLRGVISQQLVPRADGRGRVPAVEILFATPAVGNLIRERKTFQLLSIMQTGTKQGMVLMDDSIKKLLNKGLIDHEVALHYAEDPAAFRKKQ